MITNLIFKRTVKIEGSDRVEMKIVEVNIPELKSNEGWTLVSTADKVTFSPRDEAKTDIATVNKSADSDTAANFLNNLMEGCWKTTSVSDSYQTSARNLESIKDQAAQASINIAPIVIDKIEDEKMSYVKEYESPVPGTACLIRKNNTIRIAYRTGKKANINTLNRICITDDDKQNFFNAVRAENPGKQIRTWQLIKKEGLQSLFDTWNSFIDDEYVSQKKEYLRRKAK